MIIIHNYCSCPLLPCSGVSTMGCLVSFVSRAMAREDPPICHVCGWRLRYFFVPGATSIDIATCVECGRHMHAYDPIRGPFAQQCTDPMHNGRDSYALCAECVLIKLFTSAVGWWTDRAVGAYCIQHTFLITASRSQNAT